MKEIEIKAKLRNKNEVIKKLKLLGCKFEKVVTQKRCSLCTKDRHDKGF